MNNNILTKTELEIMQYLWSLDREFTAGDVRMHFSNKGWSKQAVSTFLKNLVNLGLLNVRKTSLSKYYYSVAITESDYNLLPAREIIHNIYSDSMSNFICALAKPSLTPTQVQQLENLILQFEIENKNSK